MNKRIVYFHDEEIGKFYYSHGHPMKPKRVQITYELVNAYGLDKKLRVNKPKRATVTDLTRYHSDEYIQFLQMAKRSDLETQKGLFDKFNLNEDSPLFDGIFEFCQISAGGTLSAAEELNEGTADIAINWAGGLHHAKRAEASGFCYVADCVLGILKLLERYQRVMYIDIDIHHGDGVEEAFFTSDRVLTVSFHKYGNYFPGTGNISDIGKGRGKHYSVNVPLKDGMDDASYTTLFKNVVDRCFEWYRPEAILFQSGADSLTGDRLGTFNLTLSGHAECLKRVQGYGVPLLLVGGGGYTVRNVARCWTYETSAILGETLEGTIPYTHDLCYFGPDYQLNLLPSSTPNLNTKEELENLAAKVIENIRHLPCAPAIQLWKDGKKSQKYLDDSDESDDDFYDQRLCSRYIATKDRLLSITGGVFDDEK